MKTSSVRIDNNLNDSSRIAEMITRSSKPLNSNLNYKYFYSV